MFIKKRSFQCGTSYLALANYAPTGCTTDTAGCSNFSSKLIEIKTNRQYYQDYLSYQDRLKLVLQLFGSDPSNGITLK